MAATSTVVMIRPLGAATSGGLSIYRSPAASGSDFGLIRAPGRIELPQNVDKSRYFYPMPMGAKVSEKLRDSVRKLCTEHGGVLRTAQAIRAGIHPRTLYALRDSGFLERLERGLYRLAELPALGNPDLVTVALKAPSGVICLISALAFHEITTQIPHEVAIALPHHTELPRLKFPPIRVYWFSAEAMKDGIETHVLDGVPVRIFGPEKTLADCFKYRNKIGLDTAVEALRLYRERKRLNRDALMRYAAVDRVQNVMRPYLEAVL